MRQGEEESGVRYADANLAGYDNDRPRRYPRASGNDVRKEAPWMETERRTFRHKLEARRV